MTRLRRFAFSAVSMLPFLLVLLLVEAGFRFFVYLQDQKLEESVEEVRKGANLAGVDDLRLRDIIQWHSNPRIIYDLKPDISGRFQGQTITINSDGFRGTVVPKSKGPETFRIIGLGDSVMFGWGVADSEPYLEKLPRALADRGVGGRIEVINSAVPGYNTVMEVEAFKEKLLDYSPDLLIYDYVPNDLNLPSFIRKRAPYFTLEYSFILRHLKSRLRQEPVIDLRLDHPPENVRNQDFLTNPGGIPSQYADLLGLPAFQEAIDELLSLKQVYGYEFMVLVHAEFPKPVRDFLIDRNVIIVNGFMAAHEYLKRNSIERYAGSPLTLSEKDVHPSALYHQMLAEVLANRIIGLDSVKTLLEPSGR